MTRSRFLCIALAATMFFGGADIANAQTSLDDLLTPYLAKYDLPRPRRRLVREAHFPACQAVVAVAEEPELD